MTYSVTFQPFDKQFPAVISLAPIVAVVSGARGGKTQLGAFRITMDAIEQPGYTAQDIARGEPYVIGVGAPTFPMLQRVILPTVQRYIPDQLKLEKYHETKKLLRVRGAKGETNIYFISAKFWESWYGLKLAVAWVDEFAQIKETMYDELQTRLSDLKGRLLLTGTPQGPNWAHKRLFLPWQDHTDRWDPILNAGGQVDFHSWTTLENPYIDRKFIASKKRTMPARYYRRTFLATWDTFEGQIYEEFLREVHVKKASDYRFVTPGGKTIGPGGRTVVLKKVVAGVDWGFGVGHPGAIVICGLEENRRVRRWWIVQESIDEGVLVMAEPLVDSWVSRAKVMAIRWSISNFFCDSANPEAIHHFRRAGLPAAGAVKDIIPGIETVARYLHVEEDEETTTPAEPNLYVLDSCPKTIDEFTFYHWKEGREEPEKVDDHLMDSTRYALHTHELRGRFKREPDYTPA